jgi:hypothetical protein
MNCGHLFGSDSNNQRSGPHSGPYQEENTDRNICATAVAIAVNAPDAAPARTRFPPTRSLEYDVRLFLLLE